MADAATITGARSTAAPEPAQADTHASSVLQHVHEAERQNFWAAAELLSKGMAFYLAITAALLGYVVTQDLPNPLPVLIASAGLVISIAYFFALGYSVRGLFHSLTLVEHLTKALHGGSLDGIYGRASFSQWRRVLRAITAGTFTMLVVVLIGLLLLLRWLIQR